MVHLARVARALGALSFAALLRGSWALYASSPGEGPPTYCTIFNHMVKSGGSSIKDQLFIGSRQDGQSRPGLCTSDGRTSDADCLNALHNSAVILGYGELLRKPLQYTGRQCHFFTMLRDPIDRLVSAFFYCPSDHDVQNKPIEWCGEAELEEPATARVLDFARRRWGNKTFVQMMYSLDCPKWYQHVCGEHQHGHPRANLGTPEGRQAMADIQVLLKTYAAIGIAEEWELSMKLFDATVPSPVRMWDPALVKNPGHESPKRQAVLDWARTSPEIHTVLSADLMLYEYAFEIFKQQTHQLLGTVWT